jgi:hypothetical protein
MGPEFAREGANEKRRRSTPAITRLAGISRYDPGSDITPKTPTGNNESHLIYSGRRYDDDIPRLPSGARAADDGDRISARWWYAA